MKRTLCLLFAAIVAVTDLWAAPDGPVKVWEGTLDLPTYLLGAPEKAPSFSRNFAFQRAKRGVYPYAMNDNITDKREMRTYTALFLENEYVEMCVLPEIGGRLFYAIDKTNGYDIFYHQHVIKPSNVGMLGAWISGGVEFNVFHHHRATSHIPVDYTLTENADGSKTIWVGEFEPRQRMSWAIGMTLHPGKSYIEVTGRLINQTPNTNTILYWSNVSTSVNKDYQVIFPQSTDFGVYHAKNSFCHWPMTREVFDGKPHYAKGVDASWWKNHPDPVSIFAFDLKEDFIAGYDHGKRAGTMLCGDHNIIKGGKLWQWGPGKYGAMWDTKVLTDSDGPYCELMVSAYSDNQPDYSWMNPYETKSFTKYWYGIREMESVKTGNEKGALNLEVKPSGKILMAVNSTEKRSGVSVKLTDGDKVLFDEKIDVAPDAPFHREIAAAVSAPQNLTMTVAAADGEQLLSYTPAVRDLNKPLPETVKPPKKPGEIANSEECFLVGLRNKQFHNAFVDYTEYFEEVLRRDPGDTRANTQMGIEYRERGDMERAADYLRRAVKRQTKDYTRPADCEAMYNLGLVLKAQGKFDAAVDTLYRAAWNYAFTSPAYYQLAQISSLRGDSRKALAQLDEALTYNAMNFNAANMKASLLRRAGDKTGAAAMAAAVLAKDPINPYALLEAVKCGARSEAEFAKLMRNQPESYLEVAVSYMNNGMADEAEELLGKFDAVGGYPTVKYYLGYLADGHGDREAARRFFEAAAAMPTDYCFPFRLETLPVYDKALEYMPANAVTLYYKGNLLYDKQPEAAMAAWNDCVKSAPGMAMAHRNLGWAYRFHKGDMAAAAAAYEKAVALDPSQAIFFDELDEVYELGGFDVSRRCDMLSANHAVVCARYAPLVREIRMLTITGQYDKAIEHLTSYFFSRQEGVNDLHDIHVDACLLAGRTKMKEGKAAEALKYFELADEYPDNQWVNREDYYARNAQIYYMTAECLEALGRRSQAMALYRKAAAIDTRDSDYAFYKALAMKRTDRRADVEPLYARLVELGKGKVTDYVENFFVSFGPGRTVAQVNTEAWYTQGLGHLGRGDKAKAAECFRKAVEVKPDNLWANVMLDELK